MQCLQLELLDAKEDRIDLQRSMLSLRGKLAPPGSGPGAATSDLGRLCDRHPSSTNEGHMWMVPVTGVCALLPPPAPPMTPAWVACLR
jgi:hypothetical protein